MDEAIEAILHRYLDALDRGEEPDLDDLCDGDADRMVEVRRLLDIDSDAADALRPASQSTPAELPFGRLGRYLILQRLGVGGMGEVYLARQEGLDRPVALKVFRPGTYDVDRFRREARIAASLDHRNIVPVYEVGDDRGYTFLAMKWLEGPSLDAVDLPLTPREVARLGVGVARALEEAHRCGIVHRDIKPGNVLLDGGEPCVVDFGLASRSAEPSTTVAGQVFGTLEYMPPEQIRDGSKGLGPRADVYSLGATLYHLVAGRLPFEEQERDALLNAVLLREPRAIGLQGRDRDLETIIRRAMSKEERRRFATAGELADDLENYLTGRPIVSRRSSLLERAFLKARRYPRVSIAISGAVGVAAVLGVFWLNTRAAELARQAEVERSVRQDLVDGDLLAARALLDAEPERDREWVITLVDEVEVAEALSDLLDLVQMRREALEQSELRRLTDRLAELGDDQVDARVCYAMCMAMYHLGDLDAARAWLDRVGSEDRAVVALRAMLDGEVADELPKTAVDGDPDEAVFAVLARRVAGEDPQVLLDELNARFAESGGTYRHRYTSASLLNDMGRHREALAAFRHMVDERRRNDGLFYAISLLEMNEGHLDEALAVLQRIPEERRSALYHVRRLYVLWRRAGPGDEVDQVLDELRADKTWWTDPAVLRLRSHVHKHRGEWEEVAEIASLTMTTAVDRRWLDRARIDGLFGRFMLVSFQRAIEGDTYPVLLDEVEVALTEMSDTKALSAAWGLVAMVKIEQARASWSVDFDEELFGQGLEATRTAVETDPDNLQALGAGWWVIGILHETEYGPAVELAASHARGWALLAADKVLAGLPQWTAEPGTKRAVCLRIAEGLRAIDEGDRAARFAASAKALAAGSGREPGVDPAGQTSGRSEVSDREF